MSSPERTATDLNRAISLFGVAGEVTPTDDGVIVPAASAQRLLSAIGFIEGGARVPFVRSLLSRAPETGVLLRGDEGLHLRRALEDIERAKTRQAKLDRGQIPGALSGAEVSRLARKSPHLFAR